MHKWQFSFGTFASQWKVFVCSYSYIFMHPIRKHLHTASFSKTYVRTASIDGGPHLQQLWYVDHLYDDPTSQLHWDKHQPNSSVTFQEMQNINPWRTPSKILTASQYHGTIKWIKYNYLIRVQHCKTTTPKECYFGNFDHYEKPMPFTWVD